MALTSGTSEPDIRDGRADTSDMRADVRDMRGAVGGLQADARDAQASMRDVQTGTRDIGGSATRDDMLKAVAGLEKQSAMTGANLDDLASSSDQGH